MKRALLFGSLSILLGLGAVSASATTIFSLSDEGCSSGCNVLPAGTITLAQSGTDKVQVTVQLVSDYSFRDGNATHWAFGFNLANGISGVSASNINGGGQTFSYLGSGSYNDPPLGSFQYAFNCTTCTSGANPGTQTQTLSFLLTASGLTESSFVANGSGYYFGVDVAGITQAAGIGLTGNIGANAPGVPSTQTAPTPEPGSLVLLGTGLTAIGGLVRRRMAV